jgi:hypothetical protein
MRQKHIILSHNHRSHATDAILYLLIGGSFLEKIHYQRKILEIITKIKTFCLT